MLLLESSVDVVIVEGLCVSMTCMPILSVGLVQTSALTLGASSSSEGSFEKTCLYNIGNKCTLRMFSALVFLVSGFDWISLSSFMLTDWTCIDLRISQNLLCETAVYA